MKIAQHEAEGTEIFLRVKHIALHREREKICILTKITFIRVHHIRYTTFEIM